MPRGKYLNHKGRNRKFTNPEELENQRKREENEKAWRKNRGDEESSDEEQEEGEDSQEESSSEEETDEEAKAKGVEKLIEVENPNRVQKKNKKLSTLNEVLKTDPESSLKPELSRRAREEIEKQKKRVHYQKLHSEGKTEQARADLARLAIIKQQREEAAKRREEEKRIKDEALQQKSAQTSKALGRKL